MKKRLVPVCIAGSIVCAVMLAIDGLAQQSLPGGHSEVSVTNKEVVVAAAFAIEAEEKAMQGEKDAKAAKLELVEILSASQQVVAGINYRLKLKVMLNGKEKEAEAVVWWQAWREPDPYQLTSWTWK